MPHKLSTCYIVGAGASADYGFPCGESLTQMLIEDACDARMYDTQELRDAHAKMVHALARSAAPSIDDFLFGRQEFAAVGRLAVANRLAALERADIKMHGWLKPVFHRILAAYRSKKSPDCSFIIFNYDRTVEHFFTEALTHSTGLSPDDAWDWLKSNIDFIHPHGLLGEYLPGQDRACPAETRHYKHQNTESEIRTAANKIAFFWESNRGLILTNRIRSSIDQAKIVAFLGFGFHQSNMEILHAGNDRLWKSKLKVPTNVYRDRDGRLAGMTRHPIHNYFGDGLMLYQSLVDCEWLASKIVQ